MNQDASEPAVVVNRRKLVGAFAGGIAMAAAGSAIAQQQPAAPARQKGPAVWLDLDQQELDNAYDQAKYAPNIRQVLARFASSSAIVRSRIGEPRRLKYGDAAIEGLDLYAAAERGRPINIFIHGGAWRTGAAVNYAFASEFLVRAGVNSLVVDFNNVDETSGDLMPMADQVRRAVAWVYKNSDSFGGDANRITIAGHSSGAHLGGVVAVTDWEKRFGLPNNVIKGAMLCSGLYDLKPVRLSARSRYVKFTDEMEQALSSQRHLEHLHCPLILVHGTLETPEFQRQTQDFAAAVKAAGKPVSLIVGAEYNHFEIIETFGNPYGLIGKAVLEQIKPS